MNKRHLVIGSLLILACAVSVTAAVVEAISTQSAFRNFYEHANHVRIASNRMRTDLESIQKSLLLAALSSGGGEAERYITKSNVAAADLQASFSVIKVRFRFGDLARVEPLQVDLRQMEKLREQITGMILSGDDKGAVNLIRGEYAVKAMQLEESLQYFIDFSQKKGDELLSRLNSGLTELPFFFIGISALMFLLFIVFILWKQREHVAALHKIAYYDNLTGLPNMLKFKMDAAKIIEQEPRADYFVLKFDIENFKIVNDIFGFTAGDSVLKAVPEVIRKMNEHYGMNILLLARIGADEFTLLGIADSPHNVEIYTKLFERTFRRKLNSLLPNYKVSLKYGRYKIEENAPDIDIIMEKVNMAHRIAKSDSNSAIFDYNHNLKEQLLKDILITNSMEQALEHHEFQMYLQPKCNVKSGKIVGAEALVRWRQKSGVLAQPADFIPLFEKNGFITKIDMFMLQRACMTVRRWMNEGRTPVPIAVNFSKLHLLNPTLVQDICRVVDLAGIRREYIEVEITETTMFDNEDTIISVLERLRGEGFGISMDDFGAGYSSLGLLKNIPVDSLKMDKGFLTEFKNEHTAKIVVESVISMAKRIQVSTVAEGVETESHVELLKELDCEIAQGYYYSKPVTVAEFEKLMTAEAEGADAEQS